MKRKMTLTIEYEKAHSVPLQGMFYGGISLPRHIKELEVIVNAIQDYDLDEGSFKPTGAYEINISGTRRSLFEFGKCLINLSKFKTDDPGFHEHIEGFASDPEGPPLSICLRRAKENPKRDR